MWLEVSVFFYLKDHTGKNNKYLQLIQFLLKFIFLIG